MAQSMQSAAIIKTDLVYIFKVMGCKLSLYVVDDGYIYKSEPITLDSNIDQEDLDKYIYVYMMFDEYTPKKTVNGEEVIYDSILPVKMFIKSEQVCILRRISETSTTAEDIENAIACTHLVKKELNYLKRNIDKATCDFNRIFNTIKKGVALTTDENDLLTFLNIEYPKWVVSYNTGIGFLNKLNHLVDEYVEDGIKNNIIQKCEVCKKFNTSDICKYCNK